MKVYELMEKLSGMPAGAVVRINMCKTLKEMPDMGDGLRDISFVLREVSYEDECVSLDGWAE